MGSYWKKGGSAPKKKGGVRTPWTPWIRPCQLWPITVNTITNPSTAQWTLTNPSMNSITNSVNNARDTCFLFTSPFPTHIRAGPYITLVWKSINTQDASSQNYISAFVLRMSNIYASGLVARMLYSFSFKRTVPSYIQLHFNLMVNPSNQSLYTLYLPIHLEIPTLR